MGVQPPPWLEDEPEILKLLHYFLDKLDKQPAESWKAPLSVSVERKRFPALFRLGEAADREWALIKSLAENQGLIEIYPGRGRGPYDPEYAKARIRFVFEAEARLRDWLGRPRAASALQQWQTAVDERADCFAGDVVRLRSRVIARDGQSARSLVQGFVEIGRYQDAGLTLRQLSARCFAGDSKLLDAREELLRALYPDIHIATRPLLVNVHLPARFEAVLFIENQDTYTRAVQGVPEAVAGHALVYCAGFRGGARRIREPGAVSLHFDMNGAPGEQHRFEAWWFGSFEHRRPVYFWGDLDYAGMGILAALHQRFPGASAWEAGYAPMLQALREGGGHAPEAADKQAQLDPGATGCTYADAKLLPALRKYARFMDQEFVG